MDFNEYYYNVFSDIRELKEEYPYTTITSGLLLEPNPIKISVIAVDKKMIDDLHITEDDCLYEFSKKLEVVIPFSYKESGCIVYGGKWIDLEKIELKDRHFHKRLDDGRFELCIGVPDSFVLMKNVILENVRTADRMLTAYELFQLENTKNLNLISYAHGSRGILDYREKKKKYKSV